MRNIQLKKVYTCKKIDNLSAIHVIKRSTLSPWIVVRDGWYQTHAFPNKKDRVIKIHMLHKQCDL